MKRYSEMTHEELSQLNNEEVETLIELEVAHEGIAPVDEPIIAEIPKIPVEKTKKAFQVGDNSSFYFKNRKDAEKVAGMELLRSNYDFGCGYDSKWLSALDKKSIIEEFFYKEQDITCIRDILLERERIKDANGKAKSAYDTFIKATANIRKVVWEKVTDGREFAARIEFAKERYQRYLKLADGDNIVATKFFGDAFKDEPEIMNALNAVNGIIIKDGINMEKKSATSN